MRRGIACAKLCRTNAVHTLPLVWNSYTVAGLSRGVNSTHVRDRRTNRRKCDLNAEV